MAGAGRETAYRYGRNGELLEVSDNRQRLSVAYKYDVMGRETERIFGNGVSQHTAYDKAGRVILITEKNGNNILLRGEGYVYDSLGRRSATVSHTGAVTRYEYNPAGQLAKVLYPESQELRDCTGRRESAGFPTATCPAGSTRSFHVSWCGCGTEADSCPQPRCSGRRCTPTTQTATVPPRPPPTVQLRTAMMKKTDF